MVNVSEIAAVYAKLSDELSRKIFENRLMYSISKNRKYINNIALDKREPHQFDIKEISQEELKERIGHSEKMVILYGGGIFGKAVLETIGKDKIKCFWDRKHIGEIQGIPVKNPGDDYNGEIVIISVSSLYANDIIKNIRLLGIPDNNIMMSDWGREDLEKQYFDKDIIKFTDNEVFVDGGSYNFGTSKILLEKCQTVKSIYAFEPDRNHWESVQDGIRDCNFNRVTFIKKGLWSTPATLSFESDLSESHVSKSGLIKVAVTSIDNAISEPVTFIKMDIEGSELEALRGAARHIIEDKPKLAISIYHKPEDILTLPQYILSLVPDYRLYLRHYSMGDNETVLYAVI